jgi:DNA-directed RNA polymerase subunit RPC12/RpoP
MRDQPSAERFLETEQPHWFSEPALVCCPRCGHQAIASSDQHSARVICASCGYSVSSQLENAHWVGPVFLTTSGRCGQCGRALHRAMGSRTGLPARRTSTVQCPGCQHRTVLPIHFTKHKGAVDPWFGLPLWLQMRCCGEVLWARNPSHLDFLENYVVARLRERAPNQNGSTVSRLPKWMKSAKHREELAAAIARLRLTLVQPQLREAAV